MLCSLFVSVSAIDFGVYNTNYWCNAEEPKAKIFGSTCEGESVSTTALSIDCANNLQDDDHYLGPYLDPPTARELASAEGVGRTGTIKLVQFVV